MSQEQRIAADTQVRARLGLNRKGTAPDSPPMPPRPGSPAAFKSATKLAVEDEIFGAQLYGYGEIWGRPGLPFRERSFITVSVLSGLALSDQLALHINNALNQGLTADEISETILHAGLYAGVPTWNNGTHISRYVFVERGILEPGAGAVWEVKAPTTREERRAAAARIQSALGFGRIGLGDNAPPLAPLAGGPASVKSVGSFPAEDDIEQIQAEYAFGEVWNRPTLDFRTRIVIAVAMLQALRLNDELHAHINVALNLGVTPDELHEIFLHAGCYSGVSGWRNATNVARDVFIKRGLLKAA
jgi:4-carboxymuconolactone decarboxylase